MTAGAASSDKCRTCGQDYYDCLCHGERHIPQDAISKLPPALPVVAKPCAVEEVKPAHCNWRWVETGEYNRACSGREFASPIPRFGDKCPDCGQPIRMLEDA